jgi:hypothetical protein
MNAHEIKTAIAEKVIEIKAQKAVLRQPHSTLNYGGSIEMYKLHVARREIRAMYLVYGWFRGLRADQIEVKPPRSVQCRYDMKKVLVDEDYQTLFEEWLLNTSSE